MDDTTTTPAAGSLLENRLMLKPDEVARALGIGRTACYALIAAGTIKSKKIGKSIRVPVSALKAWAEGDEPETARLKRVG